MNYSEPSGSAEPNVETRKVNDESNQPADKAAIAANQTADILKLDIDCCEEAFDYLPLQDLAPIGKTCKRMQQVAGYCFTQNYSSLSVEVSKKGILGKVSRDITINLEHFAPFIQRIMIDEHGIRNFIEAKSRFHRLKQINIVGFDPTDMIGSKKISTNKLEVLRIIESDMSNHFNGLIENCVKLKRLEIIHCSGESFWHDRKYPTLEDFTYEHQTGCITRKGILLTANVVGIPMFLEINPNIRNFGTNARFLWEQRDKMLTANIKLDNLTIDMDAENINEFNDYCNLLDRLHECGFYKQLQFEFVVYPLEFEFYQEQVNRLASLNGLNKLMLWGEETPFSYSALTSLEELHVYESNLFTDINISANTLINLKHLRFEIASIDDIMPFIRKSVEIHTIYISYLRAGVYLNENTWIIDLPELNRERSKLPDAQRITLYVGEEIFLATKWGMKGTDFGLIRLKRKQSFGWHKVCYI